jgi:hypothetical protein
MNLSSFRGCTRLSILLFFLLLVMLGCSSGGGDSPSAGPSVPPGGTPPGGTPPGGTPPGGTTPNAKTWTAPEELDTSNLDGYSPQLGFADNGDALAVWIEQVSSGGSARHLMWASKPTASGTWSLPQAVYSGTDQPMVAGKSFEIYSAPVTLQVAGDGSAWVSWVSYDIQNTNYYANVSHFDGNSWSAPQALNVDQTYSYYIRSLKIGMNNAGKVAATWSELDNKPQGSLGANTFYGNYVSVYQSASQSWTTPEKLDPGYEVESNSLNDERHLLSSVVVSEAGVVTVLFSTRNTTGNEVWTNSNANDSTWGDSTKISADADAYAQRAVVDANGDVHATWIQYNTGISAYNIVYSKRNHSVGGWSVPEYVETGATAAVSHTLDVNDNGLVAVVWAKVSPTLGVTYSDIYSAQRAANATTWTEELVVISQAQMSQPEVLVDNDNNMMILWDVLRGHNWYRYWGDGAWASTGAQRLASGYNNQLVKDHNDVFYAIWGEDNASNDANGARTATLQ